MAFFRANSCVLLIEADANLWRIIPWDILAFSRGISQSAGCVGAISIRACLGQLLIYGPVGCHCERWMLVRFGYCPIRVQYELVLETGLVRRLRLLPMYRGVGSVSDAETRENLLKNSCCHFIFPSHYLSLRLPSSQNARDYPRKRGLRTRNLCR